MSKEKQIKIAKILAIASIILIAIVCASINHTKSITYEITGGEIGEYGKRVTLNPTTDMPIDRILQKLPAGTYEVSTDQRTTTYVAVVKDNTAMTGNEKYPEELQYVITQQFEPGEKFELKLTEDESFLLIDGDKVTFKKK